MKEGALSSTLPTCARSGPIIRICMLLLLMLSVGTGITRGNASADVLDPGFTESLEKFHGHTCAGSLVGARLGHAARSALKAAGGEGTLRAKYFDHSCPVDGIQVSAGTTYGNRTIEVEDRDEQRLLLTAEKNGRQAEARLTKAAEETGNLSRELSKKARGFPIGTPERLRLEKEVEEIFAWFRTAPDADVVLVRMTR